MWQLLHRGLLLAATCGLVLAGAMARVSADDGDAVTLAWDAPPECPSRAHVLAEMSRLLGGTITVPAGGPVQVRAAVARGQPWSVTLTTLNAGQAGRRSIEAASCQDLADATALIIALMIDPDAVAAHARDRKAEVQSVPPPPAVVAAPPTPSAPGRRVAVLAALHGQASLGVLPGVDAGAGAGVGLAGRRWRVEVRGTYGLRRVTRAAAVADAYGRFSFLGGALAGCVNLGTDAVAFGPCAGAELGMVSAQGFGVSVGFPARTTWLALGGGGYAAIALGPHVAIPLHIGVLAPLRRPRYVIKEVEGTVFQAPAVGLRLAVGVELRF